MENDESKIIIDAKFYKETLKSNYGSQKITSANLYQLFSYLLNQHTLEPKTLSATGILIYPTIEREFSMEFNYSGHKIFIKTVDLNANWREIEKRLRFVIMS
ncbi:MAG: hypothetical protein ACR2MD_13450 [Aridibacter sp.]